MKCQLLFKLPSYFVCLLIFGHLLSGSLNLLIGIFERNGQYFVVKGLLRAIKNPYTHTSRNLLFGIILLLL